MQFEPGAVLRNRSTDNLYIIQHTGYYVVNINTFVTWENGRVMDTGPDHFTDETYELITTANLFPAWMQDQAQSMVKTVDRTLESDKQ